MMDRFGRYIYQPVLPLGAGGRKVSGSLPHLHLAKKGATEGTVLLKNDGTLPFQKGVKIVPFGRGTGDFLFGGGGSGSVRSLTTVSLTDALRAANEAGEVKYFTELADFYQEEARKEYAHAEEAYTGEEQINWRRSNPRRDYPIPEKLYQKAKAFGGVALYTLTRYSTEDRDRLPKEGNFYLYDQEKELLDRLCRDFEKVVVILNICGMTETKYFADKKEIRAVLMPQFGGGMAGESIVDILMGKSYPSGRLTDTYAEKLEDYPTTESFLYSDEEVPYTEDIYVGYRYFETFCPEKVVYPFGFGLNYTTFTQKVLSATREKNSIKMQVEVENTGSFSGKDVVQVYLSAPQGKLGKPKLVLCDFAKTIRLDPGEKTVVPLSFDLRAQASFDDLGKVKKSSLVLEKGEYKIFVGQNVRENTLAMSFTLGKDQVVRTLNEYMAPVKLEKRLLADGSYEKLPKAAYREHQPTPMRLRQKAPKKLLTLPEALEEGKIDAFLSQLSTEEVAELFYGHPAINASMTGCIGAFPVRLNSKKIPYIPTADGPAGFRVRDGRGPLDATYFPSATVLAQSWNRALCRKIGKAAAQECKENNVGIWLAPALNLHRSPMCGRNFEYYSEDPLISGEFASACVKGIQGERIIATIKHYLCNNKETLRRESDSQVSQRALRELYLKGFEICVKKAHPGAVMTSYNKINGVRASANFEAINGILRGEWGFEGIVMTDWEAFSTLTEEIMAGSNVKMPNMQNLFGYNKPRNEAYDIVEELRSGRIPRHIALRAAKQILKTFDILE